MHSMRGIGLAGSRAVLVLTCLAAAPLATGEQRALAVGTPGASVKDQFVGTWRLVGIERLDANGARVVPAATGAPPWIGFLMYDPAGYMGVTMMQSGRQRYAGERPTPDEAKTALAGYNSYFGTFSVDETERVVKYRLQGSLNPSLEAEQERSFQFSGTRLILRPPEGTPGGVVQEVWERVPDLPNLTPLHRRFIGFWKMVSNERTGFIIYTSSGHVAVHAVMQPHRTKYAATEPTPEEARAALSTYASYFGPYTLNEAESFVVHHQIGILNPGEIGTEGKRFYQLTGNRLILNPATAQGQRGQNVITWERISAAPGADR